MLQQDFQNSQSLLGDGGSNSMGQSPSSEANGHSSHSVRQEVPRLLWDTNVHDRVHNIPLLVPILSQMNPVHVFQPISLRSILISSHLNRCLPSGLFPSGLPTRILYPFLISSMRTTCPTRLILLYLFTLTIFGESYKLWSSSLSSVLHPPSTSPVLGPNILLSTLF